MDVVYYIVSTNRGYAMSDDDFDLFSDLEKGIEKHINSPSIDPATGKPITQDHPQYIAPEERYYKTIVSVPSRLAMLRLWLKDALSAYMSLIEDDDVVFTKSYYNVAKGENFSKKLARVDVAKYLIKYYIGKHHAPAFQSAHGPILVDLDKVIADLCEEESIKAAIKLDY